MENSSVDIRGQDTPFSEPLQRVLRHIPIRPMHTFHNSFTLPTAEQEIFGSDSRTGPGTGETIPVASSRNEAASEARQRRLFLQYNYARYMISRLVPSPGASADPSMVDSLARWYKAAIAARESLVQANMGLVLAMAKRTRIPAVDFSDLISQGSMALLRSIENFDPFRGYKFSTYACRSILRSFGRLAHEAETHRKRFTNQSIADTLRIDSDGEHHAQEWVEAIETLQDIMAKNRAKLSEIERKIVFERFAMAAGGRGKTFEEIGRMIGLTSERIRQMHKLALRKIKAAMELEQYDPPPRVRRAA